MDIQLPIMDGYEATRRIKANPDWNSIPIIVVTSYALSGDAEKARDAGCDDYVTKPYSPRQLLAKIRGIFLKYSVRVVQFPVMHSPPRILVVDDNETNRDILITRLNVHGYELLQAADGEEALAAAKQHLPDLILLDIMMPKLDGIEVTKRLKADKSMPFTPIILVTAKADSKDIVAGLDAGADEYLTKPVDQMSLVARVKSVLRIKELHDTVNDWNKTLEQRVDRPGQRARARQPAQALSRAAGCRAAAQLGRGRHQEPPARHQRGVLRPARLHRLCRDRGAGGGDGRAQRVSRLPRRADPQPRGHLGQIRRRRADGVVQRSDQVRSAGASRGPHGRRDARRGRAARGQVAQVRPPARLRHRASRTAMPPSARSASRGATTIPPSARW